MSDGGVVDGDSADADGSSDADGSADADGASNTEFPLPFSSEFELADFSDWVCPGCLCYGPSTSHSQQQVVSSPVHGGQKAVAFRTTYSGTESLVRCSLRGMLDADAVWFRAYIYVSSPPPKLANVVGTSSWNILHFRSGTPNASVGLFDVNFIPEADGRLSLGGFEHLTLRTIDPTPKPYLPLGSWFKLEVGWLRGDGGNYSWIVYRDNEVVLQVNSTWLGGDYAEFHIGNLTNIQLDPQVTVYVDDLAVTPERR